MTPERAGSLGRLWRYYQAGILNTLFGYGVYAILIKMGVWMYGAQLIAHVLGVMFNFVTYSRHTFTDFEASKIRFAASYVLNFLVGLASLFAAAQVVSSPYSAGMIAAVVASLINYFVLKSFVFVRVAGLEPRD